MAARRIVHLWVSNLALGAWQRAEAAETPPGPVALYQVERQALVVAAVNDVAARQGVRIGQPVGQARACVPELLVASLPEPQMQADMVALRRFCLRYTPLVAPCAEALDGLWLDITGCAHLFGGESAMLNRMASEITALGHAPRLACAPHPGTAWALARYGDRRRLLPDPEGQEAA